jgi:hypothetical protein
VGYSALRLITDWLLVIQKTVGDKAREWVRLRRALRP